MTTANHPINVPLTRQEERKLTIARNHAELVKGGINNHKLQQPVLTNAVTNNTNANINTATQQPAMDHKAMMEKMNEQRRSALEQLLKEWNELSTDPVKMLNIMRGCIQQRQFSIAVSLFRRWHNKRILQSKIPLILLLNLFQCYATSLFYTDDLLSAYVHYQMCLNGSLGQAQVSKKPKATTVSSANADSKKIKIRVKPMSKKQKPPTTDLLLYNGPDSKSPFHRCLTEIYRDLVLTVRAFHKAHNTVEEQQKLIHRFSDVFMGGQTKLLEIKLGDFFPDGSEASTFREMNPAIWIEPAQQFCCMNLRMVAWTLSPSFHYHSHPVHGMATRNVLLRLPMSSFRNKLLHGSKQTDTLNGPLNGDNKTDEKNDIKTNANKENVDKMKQDAKQNTWIVSRWEKEPEPDLSKIVDVLTYSEIINNERPTIMHQITDCEEIKELKMTKPVPHPNNISGFEDVKFIGPSYSNMWITFHSFEWDRHGRLRMMLAPIDMETLTLKEEPVMLKGFGNEGIAADNKEKNWLGFWLHENLFFIYSWCPLTILYCETKTGQVSLCSLDAPTVMNHWRGSAPPIELTQTLANQLAPIASTLLDVSGLVYKKDYISYLALVHNASWVQQPRKPTYSHRFVVYTLVYCKSESWRYPFYTKITHCSNEFSFDDQPVEFVNNMAFDYESGKDDPTILVPYGSRDAKAMVAMVLWKQLVPQLVAL